MIKITKDIKNEYNNGNISELFDEIDKVLDKRASIQERYLRDIDSETTGESDNVEVFFEKFITDIAAGYLSGDITYNAEIVDESEEPAYRILHPSNTKPLDPDTAAQIKYIITMLSSKNDDTRELKSLMHDAILFGAAYERQLDVIDTSTLDVSSTNTSTNLDDPNYVYYSLSALNTVALYSTDLQDQAQNRPVALVTTYTLDSRNADDNQDHTLYYCIENNPYTDTYGVSIYDETTNEDATSEYTSQIILKEEKPSEHHIPTFSVYEPDPQVSIIDPIISLVDAYETIIGNLNNMYQYNDTDAKLKIAGYRPENTLQIPNPDYDPTQDISSSNAPTMSNPARVLEDEYLANSKTFFVQEGGDVSWLLKEINATDATTYLKYYVDLIFQITGIPNTNDDAFNSGDLNASAIDRKFYTMALMLDDVRQGVITLIKHRWENFFTRINLANGTSYDINDITIEIGSNLPNTTDETINQQLALNGIISQKTLLSNLGYDYATEKRNKEEETEIPYETVTPDTAYVSPNDVDTITTAADTATDAEVTTRTTNGNTSNQIEYVTDEQVTDEVHKQVKDSTSKEGTQTREGRPTK